VTTTIERRVAALEKTTGGNKCPECGFDGDWPKVKHTFEKATSRRERYCGTCGRPLRIVLRWEGRV
jgi:predicted RNA-binding Zn-ribbon protein involved in translation (DUF1610 family)